MSPDCATGRMGPWPHRRVISACELRESHVPLCRSRYGRKRPSPARVFPLTVLGDEKLCWRGAEIGVAGSRPPTPDPACIRLWHGVLSPWSTEYSFGMPGRKSDAEYRQTHALT